MTLLLFEREKNNVKINKKQKKNLIIEHRRNEMMMEWKKNLKTKNEKKNGIEKKIKQITI